MLILPLSFCAEGSIDLPCLSPLFPRLGLDQCQVSGEPGQPSRCRGAESAPQTRVCGGLCTPSAPGLEAPTPSPEPEPLLLSGGHSPPLPPSPPPTGRAHASQPSLGDAPARPSLSRASPCCRALPGVTACRPGDFCACPAGPIWSPRPQACLGLLRGDQKQIRVAPTLWPLRNFLIGLRNRIVVQERGAKQPFPVQRGIQR